MNTNESTSVTRRDTMRFADIPSDLVDRLTSEADRRGIRRRDTRTATPFVQQVIKARRAQVFARA